MPLKESIAVGGRRACPRTQTSYRDKA